MTEIPLLDHGYVKLIESWGSDERIIEAARMSTNKDFKGWGPHKCSCADSLNFGEPAPDCSICEGKGTVPGDEGLLKYLYVNNHMTPFEMAGMILEVQAPIFVFREWHRHRTQSYNELSARYTPLPDVNYVPTVERLMMNAGTSNKQAGTIKGAAILTEKAAIEFQDEIKFRYEIVQSQYEKSLQAGIPKELARLCIPVGRYSRMRASSNLRNWLQFLILRLSPYAQWEIRQYANAVDSLVKECFPKTWELFNGKRQIS